MKFFTFSRQKKKVKHKTLTLNYANLFDERLTSQKGFVEISAVFFFSSSRPNGQNMLRCELEKIYVAKPISTTEKSVALLPIQKKRENLYLSCSRKNKPKKLNKKLKQTSKY